MEKSEKPLDQKPVQIALIGGMTRLRNQYISEADRKQVVLRVFNTSETNIAAKIRNLDAVVIFTNKISHRAKDEVMEVVRARNIPCRMAHSCGICSLRECLDCLKGGKPGS